MVTLRFPPENLGLTPNLEKFLSRASFENHISQGGTIATNMLDEKCSQGPNSSLPKRL